MQDIQVLIDQINDNLYLKKALVNPLINSKKFSTEEEAMQVLSTYPYVYLNSRINLMLNEINEAQTAGDTDALYRLEHNLTMDGSGNLVSLYDMTPFTPPSE